MVCINWDMFRILAKTYNNTSCPSPTPFPPYPTDLFDDEGFSLANVNETVSKGEGVEAVSGDDVYFLDDKSDGEEGEGSGAGSPLSEQELVDLRRARVSRPLAVFSIVFSLPLPSLCWFRASYSLTPPFWFACLWILL